MGNELLGKPVADGIKEDVSSRVAELRKRDVEPTLAVLRVGERQDDIAYESSILKAASTLGINVNVFAQDESTTCEELLSIIDDINSDASIHGCLIFRPLAKGLDETLICNRLAADKDIDGCGADSLAGVFMDLDEGFAPATACACMAILDHYGIEVAGKRLCVIGRSLVIGKPVAMLALRRNATVTLCHSKTGDVRTFTKDADIVICATGRPKAFDASYFKEGQTVLDVGMNMDEDGVMCGDVDFDDVLPKVANITPVPRGVGSVTTAVLLEHVVSACEKAQGQPAKNDR